MKKIILISLTIIFINCQSKDKKIMKEDVQITNIQTQNQNDIPFPGKNNFSKDYLINNFWKCNYSSAGEEFKYSLILPNYAKPSKLEPEVIKEASLTNIGQYKTIDKNPYLETAVYYEKTNNNQLPEEWLVNKLNLSKEPILKGAKILKDGIEIADGISSIKDGDTQIMSRHTVYKKGNIYFYVRTDSSSSDYPKLAETIQHINLNLGLN